MPTIDELGKKVKAKYPGFYDDLPDGDVGRKIKAKYPGSYDDFIEAPPQASGIAGIGQDLNLGFRSSAAHLANTAANVVSPVSSSASKGLRDWSKKEAPKPEELEARQGLGNQIAQGIGEAPLSALEYAPAMLAKRFAPLAGAVIGAVGAADKGPKEAIKAGVEAGVGFHLMGKALTLPTRTSRALGSAIANAVPAAVSSGGDINKTVAAAATGGILGAIPGKEAPAKAKTEKIFGSKQAFEVAKSIKDTVDPRGVSAEADYTGQVLRKHLGYQRKAAHVAEEALSGARKAFDQMPVNPDNPGGISNEALHFLDHYQTGNLTKMDPALRPFVEPLHSAFDTRYKELDKRGLAPVYRENYINQMWNKSDKASEMYNVMSKRPLAGSQGFTKKRVFDTIKDGIEYSKAHPDLGMELVSNNPIDLALLGIREQDKLLMAHDFLSEMKNTGMVKFVPHEKGAATPPGDWVKLDGGMSRVFRGGSEGIPGDYYMPKDAAKLVNNHLSPGLRDKPWFRSFVGASNTLNKFQLGFSAFHLAMTTIEAAISQVALGAQYAAEGVSRGNMKMLGKGLASGARALTVPFEPAAHLFGGNTLTNQIIEEYRKPGTHPNVSKLVDMLARAGGDVAQDPMYRGGELRQSAKGVRGGKQIAGILKDRKADVFSIDPKVRMDLYGQVKKIAQVSKMTHGLLGIPGAFTEKSMAWLFEYAVPQQKVGAFHRLAQFELDKLGPNATEVQETAAIQKAWDSVDNRFGQLVYDNLFWQKTTKDLMMAAFRSVGWRLGTVREIGGGVKDWGTFVKQALQGKPKEFTGRMAYTLALPIVTGTIGGISHYLMTGQAPKDAEDYFMPWTGEVDENGHKRRVNFPSYMKDVNSVLPKAGESYPGRLLKYAKGAINPGVSIIMELIDNKDWMGGEIRGKDGEAMDQIQDLATYAVKQMVPFAFSAATQASNYRGKDSHRLRDTAGQLIGITPAPSDVSKAPYERYEAEHPTFTGGTRTRRAIAKQQLKSDMVKSLRFKEEGEFNRLFKMGVSQGHFKEEDEQKIRNEALGSPGVVKFRGLSLPNKLMAYQYALKDPNVPQEDKAAMLERLQYAIREGWPAIQKYPDDDRIKIKVRNQLRLLHMLDERGDFKEE